MVSPKILKQLESLVKYTFLGDGHPTSFSIMIKHQMPVSVKTFNTR